MVMELNDELCRINKELACNGIRLRIEQRGQRLNLRGPLPCSKSQGSKRTQRLNLGLSANPEGLKEAQKILQLVLLQLQFLFLLS